MDASSFSAWLSGIGLLTADQRSSVLAELSRTAVSVTAVSPPGNEGADPASDPSVPATEGLMSQIGQSRLASFGCPHCGGDSVGKWGQASGKPRYRCRDCGKTFNPLTGTPLSGLHYPDRWPDQAQALIAGETIVKAAERCRVDYTTAFRWRHRFLAALNHDKPARLSGIVEADETFILESFKGKRHGLPRASRKRGGKAGKRGLSTEQIPVLVARDRSGATIDAVLPRLDAKSIKIALGDTVVGAGELCCDGGAAIKAFARQAKLRCHVLPAPGGPRPDAPNLHINNVNAYHGRLKEWMRRFHGVATVNLPNYLSWRRTIEALGHSSAPHRWVKAAAGLGPYQQTTR